MARQGVPEVYTIQEAKELLKTSDETVYRLIRSGKLEAVRVGRLWRVRVDSLRRMLEGGRR